MTEPIVVEHFGVGSRGFRVICDRRRRSNRFIGYVGNLRKQRRETFVGLFDNIRVLGRKIFRR